MDEAHTAAAPTDRHAALAAIAAPRAACRLHHRDAVLRRPAGFASMAALGARHGGPPPLMFRRSRADVGDPRRRRHRFVPVRITRAEDRLQRLLERYSRDVWQKRRPTSKARGWR